MRAFLRSLVLVLVPVVTGCSASSQSPSSPADAATLVDTGVSPDVGAATLADEAGFIDVEPQVSGAAYPARMFYSLRAATGGSAGKPLFFIFDGGPGAPTTTGLAAYGTGASSVDWTTDGGASLVTNTVSFASLGNLLYVDERQSGFSYGLGADGGSAPSCAFSALDDAADYLRVLLRVFRAHDALRDSNIVFVGESYGGTRATAVLHILLHYKDSFVQALPGLSDEIQAFYDALFPDAAGTVIPPSRIATRVGRQVLIEPLVLGPDQLALLPTLIKADPYVGPAYMDPTKDPYDVQEPAGWAYGLVQKAIDALAVPALATQLLGADVRQLKDLGPSSRGDAFRVRNKNLFVDPTPLNLALTSSVGSLAPGDAYFEFAPACTVDYTTYGDTAEMEGWFIDNLATIRTFITHARYDAVQYPLSIPAVLQMKGFGANVDSAPRPGVDRPGWIQVTGPDGGGSPGLDVEIRFPPYDESGHEVAVTQGADLANDVATWLAGP